ncbi:MAG: transposase [Pseudomonadota bacterium]|nr:transposase [Pseudomonadota bacterium]
MQRTEKTRRIDGAKRLHKELQEEGFVTGRDRVVRLRQEMGLCCKQRRHFRITTQSDHDSHGASEPLA